MTIIVILVVVSLSLAAGFLTAFLWAVRSGQFDDTYTPSVRILMDNKKIGGEQNTEERISNENHKTIGKNYL